MSSLPERDPTPGTPSPAGPEFTGGVRWGSREIVLAGVFILLSIFALFLLAEVALSLAGYDAESVTGRFVQLFVSFVWDATIVAIVYRFARSKGSGWRDLGLRAPLAGSTRLGPTVLLAYIVSIALVQTYVLSLNLLGLEDLLPAQQIPEDLFDETPVLLAFAVLGVTLVPFAEELFFRGFFFAGLRRRLPFIVAATISGFFFSLAHADPGLIIPFTGVGIIFAYIFERTRSLYAPIGVHVLFNLVSFAILILLPEARG